MNLIEAWSKAGEGISIQSKKYGDRIYRNELLLDKFRRIHIPNEALLADDWEIVKEKKKVVIDEVMFADFMVPNSDCMLTAIESSTSKIPKNINMKVTLEWEE